MNTRICGAPLTTDDLVGLALAHGVIDEVGIRNARATHDSRFHSFMHDVTRDLRHRLFMAGRLGLRTPHPRGCKCDLPACGPITCSCKGACPPLP